MAAHGAGLSVLNVVAAAAVARAMKVIYCFSGSSQSFQSKTSCKFVSLVPKGQLQLDQTIPKRLQETCHWCHVFARASSWREPSNLAYAWQSILWVVLVSPLPHGDGAN